MINVIYIGSVKMGYSSFISCSNKNPSSFGKVLFNLKSILVDRTTVDDNLKHRKSPTIWIKVRTTKLCVSIVKVPGYNTIGVPLYLDMLEPTRH